MKYLSRNDLETIGGRVIEAYKRLPAISGQALERVDIDFLCQELLGLRIDYARLSLNGEKIGLTSSCDIGVEVFPEDPSSTEEQYYMLDGKTILIESDLMKEGANIGRRNYTVSHESCHHMLERKIEALNNKMLALVNESVSSGDGIEAHESEFMTLSQEAELLKQRIAAIQESTAKDNGEQNRLEQIQAIIAERESKCMEYDDSIVRQMVECIKVYPGGKLEIIFGGGYLVEESV